MIYHVKARQSDDKEIILGANESEEQEHQDERIQQVNTLIDQHYEIEVIANGLDQLSTIRFRAGGSWSEPTDIKEVLKKLDHHIS